MSVKDPCSMSGPERHSALSVVLAKARSGLSWLVGLNGSPEAVAAGVAIGLFVAFTPTIGFQVVIAASLATLLRANRAAAVVGVWTTNPVTIPPIYAFTYQVGCVLWPAAASAAGTPAVPMAGASSTLGWRLLEKLMVAPALGREVAVPLIIGGAFVGAILATLSYVITVEALRAYRRPMKTAAPAGSAG